MDTSNKTIVTIKGASELRYIINTTKKGMLSFNVSATTIKEGPYAAGEIMFVYKGSVFFMCIEGFLFFFQCEIWKC